MTNSIGYKIATRYEEYCNYESDEAARIKMLSKDFNVSINEVVSMLRSGQSLISNLIFTAVYQVRKAA